MKKSDTKKTDFISFRTDSETKNTLIEIAESKKWSISQLVEEIVQEWLQKRPEEKTNT
jgi:predicted DNA-binding ribbon-helix-helix protein